MTDPDDTPSTPTVRVLETIADAEDVSPAVLEPPLGDVVDADALDRFFESTAGDESTSHRRVSFSYRGYDVTITSDGVVELAD